MYHGDLGQGERVKVGQFHLIQKLAGPVFLDSTHKLFDYRAILIRAGGSNFFSKISLVISQTTT